MRTRTVDSIVARLRKGQSLRQIGEALNLDHKAVWRVGDRYGVYSVRSERKSRKAK